MTCFLLRVNNNWLDNKMDRYMNLLHAVAIQWWQIAYIFYIF